MNNFQFYIYHIKFLLLFLTFINFNLSKEILGFLFQEHLVDNKGSTICIRHHNNECINRSNGKLKPVSHFNEKRVVC